MSTLSATGPRKAHNARELLAQLGIAITGSSTSSQPSGKGSGGTKSNPLERVCVDGERTRHLTRLAGHYLGMGVAPDEVARICLDWNTRNTPPLKEDKVAGTVASVAKTHLRNHPDTSWAKSEPLTPLFDLAHAEVGSMLTAAPPPRDWLLDDYLPYGKVGAVIAPGGTGKSQYLLQLGVAVATGGKLCDFWEVGSQGNTLLLFAEEDREDVHRRLYVIKQELSASTVNFDKFVTDHLKVMCLSATDLRMTGRNRQGKVEATDFFDRLSLALQGFTDIKLIVFDPGSRFRGGDENAAEDATRFVEQLERVAKRTGATVLVAHHTRKGASNTEETDQSASRGSSALTDGVRWQMNLRVPTDAQLKTHGLQKNGQRRFLLAKVTKSNYSPPSEEQILVRKDSGYLVVLQSAGGPITLEDRLIDLIRTEAAAGKTYSAAQVEDTFGGETGLLKVGKNAVRDALTSLLSKGHLAKGKGRHLRVTANAAYAKEAKANPMSDIANDASRSASSDISGQKQ